MIRATGLSKRYGATLALDRLSVEVPVGSVFGLIGPNGAGKTTFLRLVMGLVFPSSGTIERGGLSPSRIGYLPERAFYPSGMRVREYLLLIARLAGVPGQYSARLPFASMGTQESAGLARQAFPTGDAGTVVDRLLANLRLQEVSRRRLGSCSRGMLQRVGIGQALLGDPPVVLLDEPVSGLDPAAQKFMRDQILALHEEGKTVVLSSHNLGEVARVCTHVAILNHGRMVQTGPMAEILPSRALVTIATGPMPEGLASELAALDGNVQVAERQVTLIGDAVAHKVQVLLMLMNAGVDIRDLSERRASLEEVYLEATAS